VCGIAGICNFSGEPVPPELIERMTDAIAHRGPDGAGHHIDGGVALGNRRLAIMDLSAAGAQPMASEDGQIVVTYNGEIFNFPALRDELETLGHRFYSNADTEVLVHGYEEYGPGIVQRLNGMFAFAILDKSRRRLFLARDRHGIKPLYWTMRNGTFVFASEIKAILEHPSIPRCVDPLALNEYFTFQNIYTDRTLFAGISLLPAASTIILDVSGTAEPHIETYWDYTVGTTVEVHEAEAAEELARLFRQAVTRQLMSDVPVGSYLSGGLDSGSITSIASQDVDRLMTFTAGFDLTSASGLELGFDERPAAEAVANQFKTEHYEVVLHAGDMEWALPHLIWHQEDLRVGQCYPNYYVARLASKFVKAVLSGAGGDELFGGYPWRYYRGAQAADREDYLQRYYAFWQRLVVDEERQSLFNGSTRAAVGDHSSFEVFHDVFRNYQGGFDGPDDLTTASLYFELKTFLHGLLIVEDKLSMAHSLETRVPFLDNDLVDFAMQLPVRHKVRNHEPFMRMDENVTAKRQLYNLQSSDGKVVLREAMRQFVSPGTAGRVKQGFSAPDASWFRGESIDYINRLLRDPAARINEFFDPREVGRILDEHCGGRANRRLVIWSLLSFEWWLRIFIDGDVPLESP